MYSSRSIAKRCEVRRWSGRTVEAPDSTEAPAARNPLRDLSTRWHRRSGAMRGEVLGRRGRGVPRWRSSSAQGHLTVVGSPPLLRRPPC